MIVFECAKCHKCFFMEDAQAADATYRSCPNCGEDVPRAVLGVARAIVDIPHRDGSEGWDVTHLPDQHFKASISVTSKTE